MKLLAEAGQAGNEDEWPEVRRLFDERERRRRLAETWAGRD